MSFEDYVNHITQKYRLAISIAVLKSKPEDLSIEQYITVLQDKMNGRSIDDTDDMDISICSDDFALDDNDAGHVINEIFYDAKKNDTGHINNGTSGNNYEKCDAGHIVNDTSNGCKRNTDAELITDDISSDMEIETEVNNSMTILKDLDVNLKTVEAPEIINVQSDTLKILRNIEEDMSVEKSNYTFELDNFSQATCYEGFQGAYNPISSKTNDKDTINKYKNVCDDILGQNNIQLNENKIDDDTQHSQIIDKSLAAKISKNLVNLATNDSKRNEIRIRNYDENTFINREDSSRNSRDVRTTMPDTIKKPNNVSIVTSNDLHEIDLIMNLEKLSQSEYSSEQNNYLASKVYQNLNKQSNAEIKKANDERFELKMPMDLEKLDYSEYNNKYDDQIANKVCKTLNKPLHLNDNIQKDSQETELYSMHGLTQTYTHVSQSQIENIDIINKKFILGNKERNTKSYENGNSVDETYLPSNCTISANVDKDNETQIGASIEKETINVNNKTPQIIEINSDKIQYTININGRHYKIPNLNCLGNERNTVNIVKEQNSQMCANKLYAQTSKSNENTEKHKNNTVFENAVELQDTNVLTENINTQAYPNTLSAQNSDTEDLTVSQKEMVPFKVIEELNKVKVYLGRKDREISMDDNHTDSGYKTDSQSRSCYKNALQLSQTWLNQSAHCLYTYLLHSPLVATAQEITREISQVLGRIIDRLHEDEEYPSFLEDLLESVDVMLQDVYQGESSCDNVLLKKDENIQRLFLLNKSLHIIKYTMEKINDILENVHSFLTSEQTYELTNIVQTENICYIFHILETLIKRYMKNKHLLTQDTSQNETKLLKKSSITDIWRKKWNPDYKKVKFEVNVEKRCVLTKCGDTLNKIIVDCMEGYSLVAFTALQCFNLLQSQ